MAEKEVNANKNMNDAVDENEINDESLVEVCLNNKGQDYLVVVPLQTATILLNDPEEASKFIESQLKDKVEPVVEESQERKVIWSSKKPTGLDHEATQYFLKLRDTYSPKFEDKKTIKRQLWHLIAQKMNAAGYYVGEGREAIEKCRMKFANMQKQYLLYIRHTKTTGVEHKEPPSYFDDIHKILGGQDKVDPKNLQDSLHDSQIEKCENEEVYDPGSSVSAGPSGSGTPSGSGGPGEASGTGFNKSVNINNRFSRVRSVKPISTNVQMIDILKHQNTARQKNFEKLEKILDTQNHQRERLLDQFQSLIDLQKKKRRRRNSSSSDSS